MSTASVPNLFGDIKAARRPSKNGSEDFPTQIPDWEAYPCLTHLLTELPKGAVKGAKTGGVSFFVRAGRLTACVTVPSIVTKGFVTLNGFMDAFGELETRIRTGTVDWSQDDGNGRSKR